MAFKKVLKSLSLKKPPVCTAVIVAAGTSQRCKGEDKLFYLINDKPVLAYTISAFQNSSLIREIIVVAREEQYNDIGELCLKYGFKKVTKIMKGGPERSESVINGVFAVSRKAQLIAIHDGARPCIEADTIEKTIMAAAKYHAAAPAVEVIPTIKRIESSIITETIDRESLVEIQTPQVFRTELIKAALTNAVKKSITITDDCMAVEVLGFNVHLVEGSRSNIKITETDDLFIAESILSRRKK